MVKVELTNKKQVNVAKKLFKNLGTNGFPTTKYAVLWATQYFKNSWINNVSDADTPEGWKTFYINRIKDKKNSDYESEVYAEPHKFINFIENGIKSRDMKEDFMKSKKVKKYKNGKEYLTIFMQKRKREIKSKTVKKQLKEIDHYRPTGTKLDGKEKIYSSSSSASISSGIDGRITKVGSPKHSGFGTFVRVTKKSKQKPYPHIPGSPVFSDTIKQTEPKIKMKIEKAFLKDLAAIKESLRG